MLKWVIFLAPCCLASACFAEGETATNSHAEGNTLLSANYDRAEGSFRAVMQRIDVVERGRDTCILSARSIVDSSEWPYAISPFRLTAGAIDVEFPSEILADSQRIISTEAEAADCGHHYIVRPVRLSETSAAFDVTDICFGLCGSASTWHFQFVDGTWSHVRSEEHWVG
ncbi:MAG: hypothetical protein RLN87_03400 [Parasphingopyxis sp.]|uniref:hypothetical protein n=1 Tax=Parasphingopyxis sp. TaxID=1920299 RepID=UPI0032EC180E